MELTLWKDVDCSSLGLASLAMGAGGRTLSG